MKVQEVLESSNIISDSKARRVLNTAPDQFADITLQEIEAGITIERLETIKVPVYQYGTQITIHGIFKDIPQDLRVCGYKSVFLNGNGSLGVKYVAIDGAKKRLLREISRVSDDSWNIAIDSQGCEAYKVFLSTDHERDKQQVIECYKNTPDDLYIGNKRAAALMYGGYAVILHIGAIYERNLWPLIKALTEISSQQEADSISAAREAQRVIDNAKWEAEHKAQREAANKLKAQSLAELEPLYNWVINPECGIFYSLSFDYEGKPEYCKVEFKKRGKQLLSRRSFRCETLERAQSQSLYDRFHFTTRKDGCDYRYIVDAKITADSR